jgi:glycosyltransferase involved in cell wall biosynthesis
MSNRTLPQLIFIGRLSREKWFDRVLQIVDSIIAGEILATLHICGDGIYMDELLARPNLREHGIFVHGFIWATEMNPILADSQYMLMPSRFLETFGLSALESITRWVPIIGFCKGGLAQFVSGPGAIVSSDPAETSSTLRADLIDSALYQQRVMELCEKYDPTEWQLESQKVQQFSHQYSRDIWYATLSGIIWSDEHVLIVTDYSGNIGGIESYTKSITEEFKSRGHTVSVITSSKGTSRWLRYFGLIGTAWNVSFAMRLTRAISLQKPEVISLQSVMRAIGPVGLLPLLWYRGKVLITYHDLGYFVPYPTQILHESQIGVFGWKRFAQDIHGPFSAIAIFAKYMNLLLLRAILRRADAHFIPSAFLRTAVQSFYGERTPLQIVLHAHFNPHIWA